MMWVCRAGQKSIFIDYYLKTNRLYIPWEGFKKNLREYENREAIKKLVLEEKWNVAKTSISNWAGQLYSFCYEMSVGDYVLIPFDNSKQFVFAEIIGDYAFNPNDNNKLWHSRPIKILEKSIPHEIFSQSLRYSLGAYRTIFKIKGEGEVLSAIKKNSSEKRG